MAASQDLLSSFEDLEEARPAYAKAQSYYDGDVDEIYASDAVARILAKSNLDEIDELNFARIPVRAVLNRLHITSITTGDDPADEAIADLITSNQLDMELPGLLEKACSLGDAYMMVWPNLDADGNIVSVGMTVHSPTTVRVIYDEEHPLQVRLAIKSWCIGTGEKETVRADLYYPPETNPEGAVLSRVERYAWAKGKKTQGRKGWQPYTDDGQPAVITHDYGFPFHHFRTDRPYGRPEHYGAYGAQTLINKLVIAHASVIDYESLPTKYGLIDPQVDQPGQQADFDPDYPEDTNATPEEADNPSQLSSDPGEFWQLQGYKSVGQFQAADPDTFMKPLDRYIKAMSQVTETPFHLFDSTGDQMSGASRREANSPLIARVMHLQRAFGPPVEDAFEHALALLDHEGVTVQVRWQPPEQIDDAEGWATVGAKIEAGVPREQALIETGRDPEQVRGWMTKLDDDAELARRVELLTSLGTAVQALGTGVQLGAITDAQVSQLLDTVLGATVDLNALEPGS
ncbi:MAG TPA: phage portal protein [Nocardioides sp.]